jgi:hypothetical protein
LPFVGGYPIFKGIQKGMRLPADKVPDQPLLLLLLLLLYSMCRWLSHPEGHPAGHAAAC